MQTGLRSQCQAPDGHHSPTVIGIAHDVCRTSIAQPNPQILDAHATSSLGPAPRRGSVQRTHNARSVYGLRQVPVMRVLPWRAARAKLVHRPARVSLHNYTLSSSVKALRRSLSVPFGLHCDQPYRTYIGLRTTCASRARLGDSSLWGTFPKA